MKYQAIKGMSDILSPEVEKWQILEKKSHAFFKAHLFREVRTPVVEYTELFTRSIGESSDIVHKEMYTFQDRAERSLTLRPEMTASCVRAAIEGGLLTEGDITKLYYLGPMFRAERPQAGRKRQFHQVGVEVFGSEDAVADAQTIALLSNYLKYLGLQKFTVKINNLGSSESRAKYIESLKPYFQKHEKELCEDCHFRLSKNVLRVFDCKNPNCRKTIDTAPKIFDSVDEESRNRFKEVESFLKVLNVSYIVEKGLVRGLDYYSQTVFEVTSEALGAQDALGAGGRYDRLVGEFGGPKMGAVGFAIGIERLLEALKKDVTLEEKESCASLVYLANTDRAGLSFTLALSEELRKAGVAVMINELGKSLKAQLRQADKWQARWVVICGEEEIKTGELTVKDLKNHQESKMKKSELIKNLVKA